MEKTLGFFLTIKNQGCAEFCAGGYSTEDTSQPVRKHNAHYGKSYTWQMQNVLHDPVAIGLLIFGLLLNLAALGMHWQKKLADKVATTPKE